MPTTNFVPFQTPINADWLNEVDAATFDGAAVYTPAGTGAVTTTVQTKLRESVSVKDFGAVGDGVTDDRLKLIAAMDAAVLQSRTLFVPDGVYAVSNWMPIPSGLKMVFAPDAVWKLTAATTPGGFVIGGYTITLTPTSFADVEIHGMALDCNSVAGENGFSALNASNVRLLNPKITNALHDPISLGGRAFQFEGGTVDGVHIYSPYIEDCSIGINSQGSPAGTTIAININYYDVVMRNVDVPFNVDSQYLNPETNTFLTMGTFVHGIDLFNCGKLTWPGHSGATGGGIVCGDRGAGVKISGMKLVNDAAYGDIGALVRGNLFNISLADVQIQCPGMTALFDFNTLGFGYPSASTFASTVTTSGISYKGNLDYIIKGGPSNARIGASCFGGVQIDSSAASLTGVMDANAGTGTSGSSASLELLLSNSNFKSTGLRSLASIYLAGNSIGVCQTEYEDGPWTPIDASGAGLSLIVAGSPWYVRNGRLVTAMCSITYPATADVSNAVIGGLPFASANLSVMGGVGAIGYTTETTLANMYVVINTTTAVPSTASGGVITNATLSGDNIRIAFTYIV